LNLSNRKYVLSGVVIAIFIIFTIRLFYMQVVDDSWKKRATSITETSMVLKPPRGLIFDRFGELLVTNQAVYDLMVIPRQIKDLDTLAFCELLGIEKADFIARMNSKDIRKARHKSHILVSHIMPSDYARISEKLNDFKGFFGQPTTMRYYPKPIAALFLGDVREVAQSHIDKDPYYVPGDYVGDGGIEKAYEVYLRGKKGVKFFYRDNRGLLQDVAEGRLDSSASTGVDVHSTIDARLQEYGELLMQNKKGCIVAIEPKTGEILAMVNAPTYDPNILVGKDRGKNFALLDADPLKPLYNRVTKGAYRPGSIFKMVQALAALQGETISPQTRISCNRSIIGCHGAHSYDDLRGAIQHSCNPYFREVMKRMVESGTKKSRFEDAHLGLDIWRERVVGFGFGTDLQTDLEGVRTGLVPGSDYYDHIYGFQQWAFSTIYSISIGEGELLITPLHMANLASIIANRGWYIPPHSVRQIGTDGPLEKFTKPVNVGVDQQYFDVVVEAMQAVVEVDGGTARRARIEGIEVCGKTGTVQNDPLPDHSVFMAFAPKDDPQIAIAVYVESAGFGGTWAAPVASLMMELYLTDSISNKLKEKTIIEAVILDN
jgi:penicillin-binding protein 2